VANENKSLVVACFVIIAALLVVGAVSHGVIRHIVQTAPLWFAIVLGLRGSEWSKWAAIPCFVFWAVVMILIWLFLLGWARIVTGTFSPTETAMTIVVGLASIWGVVKAFKIKTNIAWWKGILLIGVLAVLQVGALRLSFMSLIAHR
jgi:hypothetical protein